MARSIRVGLFFAIALTATFLEFLRSAEAQSPGTSTVAQAAESGNKTLKFNPRRLLRAQPAITSPKTLKADQVTDQVTDQELVIGLKLNGQARAYPINMLTGPRREIINDTIGGTPIAATW